MPAGKYEVSRFEGSASWLINISDGAGHSRFLNVFPEGTANPDKPQLTFECRGHECQLSTISVAGSNASYGLSLHKSNYRLGMATQIAVRITH